MRARSTAAAAASFVVCVLLTGCVDTYVSTSATTNPSTSTPPTVNVDGFTPPPTVPANGLDGQDTPAGERPVSTDAPAGAVIPSGDSITPELAARAEVAADGFIRAFVRKDVSGQAWEDGYLVFLTPYSQKAYQGTGQTAVPGTQVTGSAALAEDGTNTATSAVVTVPTDAGVYQVVTLVTGTGEWLVQRALLPGATL